MDIDLLFLFSCLVVVVGIVYLSAMLATVMIKRDLKKRGK
jgi:hypothetical protein